jgi:hypothetical protein
MEAFYPLRIVIGYYGYKNEFSLREGFVNILEEKVSNGPVKGYSPISFPNLLICGECSILKTVGMPFGVPFLNKDFYWPLLITSNEKPIYNLLELIWTRLSYKFDIGSSVFGDDFQEDGFHPLLFCKEKKIAVDSWGWEYLYNEISRELLEKPLTKKQWKPLEISRGQFVILNLLLKFEQFDYINDIHLKNLKIREDINIEKTIQELENEQLVYREGSIVRLLIDELLMVSINGKIYAGENKSGQMMHYINSQKFE